MKLFGTPESGRRGGSRRGSTVSVLDIGSTKICCLIARLKPRDSEALRRMNE